MSTSTATHHLDDMLLFDNILVTASLQDPSIFAPSSSMRTPPSGSNNNDVSGTWECDDFEDVTEQETRVSRIGISESPQYNSIGADYYQVLNDVRDNDNEEQDNEATDDEEEAADHKSFDSRIGISPSVYQQPDVPESPQQLFLKQQTTTVASPTEMPDFMYDRPQHVYFGDSDGNVSALYSSQSEAEDHVVHQILPPITRSKRKKLLHQEEDGIRRLFHPQTKRGHFLIHANVAMPTKRIKYNLTSKTAQLLNGGGGGDIMDDSISTTSTHSIMSESVASCSSPHKIFILLLNPEAKLFELIQVIYNPHDASIFNIMEWIPANSTEPLLGHAPYTGLVRPKERHVPLNRGMASHGDHGCQDHHCSILCGEILVAIPQYYTSEEIVRYAKPILKDRQVLELLKRKNPLAPPSSSRMYKKCHKQSPTKNAPKTSPHKSVKYQRLDNEVDDEDDNELYVEYCETSFVSNQEEEEDELVVLKKKKKKGFLYQLIKPFRWLVRHF